jgi:hypothetical protein
VAWCRRHPSAPPGCSRGVIGGKVLDASALAALARRRVSALVWFDIAPTLGLALYLPSLALAEVRAVRPDAAPLLAVGDAQAGVKRQQRQHPVPRCGMVSAYDLMYTGRYDLTCIGRARPIMPCSVLSFDRGELLVEHPDADQHRCPGPRPPAVTPSSALPRTVVTLSPHDGRPSVNTSRMITLDQGETPTTAGFPYESSLGDKLHRHDCSP